MPSRCRCVLVLLLGAALGGCGASWEDDLPGAYTLDRASYAEAAYVRRVAASSGASSDLGHVDARRELEAALRAEALQEARAIRMLLKLASDGTFRLAYRYPKEEGHAAGHVAGRRRSAAPRNESGRGPRAGGAPRRMGRRGGDGLADFRHANAH